MKISDDLFSLIKTLTKDEKRLFKMHSELQRGEKDYVLLFDALDSMPFAEGEDGLPCYEESLLSKRLNGKVSLTRLRDKKKYLLDKILASLHRVGNQDKDTVEEKVKSFIEDAKVLNARGLKEAFQARFRETKDLAIKFEKHACLIELIQMELKWHFTTPFDAPLTPFQELHIEILTAVEKLQCEVRYQNLYEIIILNSRIKNRVRDTASLNSTEVSFSNELLSNPSAAITFLSKASYYFCHALLNTQVGEYAKAKTWYLCLLEHWSGKNEFFQKEYPIRFINQMTNYLNCCNLTQDFDAFPKILANLEKLPARNYQEQAEAFLNIWFLVQLYFINFGMLRENWALNEKAQELAKNIAEGLKKFATQVQPSRKLAFYSNTTVMFFALNDYNNAKKWIQKIHQHEKTNQRKDVQLLARLLNLLIYYDEGKHLYIENEFKNFAYHLKKDDKQADFEGVALKFLRKLNQPKLSKKEVLTEWQKNLSAFEENRIIGYEEISIWIESKLKNKKFLEVLRERRQKNSPAIP